jgi:ribosome biogenesis GTPase
MQGKIVKGVAGFYYVHVKGSCTYECKAKGIFRKDNKKPLVGDDVVLDILDEDKALGNIREILPRKNETIRPAAANVDQALVIFSIAKPRPNFYLLDRFLVVMGKQGVPCVICFNKSDLDHEGLGQEYEAAYRDCGCHILNISVQSGKGMEGLILLLTGKTTTMAGPSGVGKSSLINCIQPNVIMETNTVSRKNLRGRHTTRHTELITIRDDTYILDTPGFSSLHLSDMEKEELSACYPEFRQFENKCRFVGCAHIGEPDCGVKEAVREGKINKMRYDNYCQLYEELKNIKKY